MGDFYRLVNQTRREQIGFGRLPVRKKSEIAGNPAAAAIVARYLLDHRGDAISFVNVDSEEWPFAEGSAAASSDYPDVTDAVLDALVADGILRDDGFDWIDEQDPRLYTRTLTSVFMSRDPTEP